MEQSKINNVQPEQQLSSDNKLIDTTSSPTDAKPIVGCSANLSDDEREFKTFDLLDKIGDAIFDFTTYNKGDFENTKVLLELPEKSYQRFLQTDFLSNGKSKEYTNESGDIVFYYSFLQFTIRLKN